MSDDSNIHPGGTSGPGLITMTEAAAWLSISERMVRRLQFERKIAYVKIGRHVRFRPEDLVAYRDHQVQAATAFEPHGHTAPVVSRPSVSRAQAGRLG